MTSASLKAMLHEGSRFDLPYARVYYRAAQNSSPQSACIVGRKVHTHATVRHRYQRLLREATRKFLKTHPGYDMVVVAKTDILRIQKLQELQNALAPAFEQIAANSKLKT